MKRTKLKLPKKRDTFYYYPHSDITNANKQFFEVESVVKLADVPEEKVREAGQKKIDHAIKMGVPPEKKWIPYIITGEVISEVGSDYPVRFLFMCGSNILPIALNDSEGGVLDIGNQFLHQLERERMYTDTIEITRGCIADSYLINGREFVCHIREEIVPLVCRLIYSEKNYDNLCRIYDILGEEDDLDAEYQPVILPMKTLRKECEKFAKEPDADLASLQMALEDLVVSQATKTTCSAEPCECCGDWIETWELTIHHSDAPQTWKEMQFQTLLS
ncbi:MAG: hypothetical protein LUD72_05555 [Bacteroidales bacterium]|nr:hypothetical protein [Bacteroidales bacterium]